MINSFNTDAKAILSYAQVSLNLYRELKEIAEDVTKSETLRSAEIVAILNNKTLDEILQLPISEFQELVANTDFLNYPEFNLTKSAPKKLVIDGVEYEVQLDVFKWTTSQFMDFQEFIKSGNSPEKETFKNVLACIVVPKGKSYGTDYDPVELANLLGTSLDIQTACKIFFYLLRRYRGSMKIILKYLEWIMKKVPKEIVEKLKNQIALTI